MDATPGKTGNPDQCAEKCAESHRLAEDAAREKNWKRWGPYLAERQWGTVREDYSADGRNWSYFTHEDAVARAYRWGEDGLLGITDRQGRLCFSVALWNGNDPILKERLFGLTGPEGNHGEDVKEVYFYLDSTPTHSYMKGLYKYPQAAFPYEELRRENASRSKLEREYELADTGIFDDNHYFDVQIEYAKGSPNDILIRIVITNRSQQPAPLHVLPTLWFRNTWSHGRSGEGYWPRPKIEKLETGKLRAAHASSLGEFQFLYGPDPDGEMPPVLFTENETNNVALFGTPNEHPYVKDAFHRHVVNGTSNCTHPGNTGTKAAPHYRLNIPAGESVTLRLRLSNQQESPNVPADVQGSEFDRIIDERIKEADSFFQPHLTDATSAEEASVARQAYAGLLWTKQYYHFSVRDWLRGDPNKPAPPANRSRGRNHDWSHLYNRDVISMPDKWEYPWYAAWDLAFHMVPFATIDPDFAKEQLLLLLREWYMHPSGQIPAYEFEFGDVNPPVHAWAAWQVYQRSEVNGKRDRSFLSRIFHKLLINFTWWINRKDVDGNHIFSGGFLGLDNIGVFDRSRPLPGGGHLDQADATAWMAFYCANMLTIALELAREDESYEGVASKFFEHFVAIADAMNQLGGNGLWDAADGFYYDQIHRGDTQLPMRTRSLVGLLPIVASCVLDESLVNSLPGFRKRTAWFLENRKSLASQISYLEKRDGSSQLLLAIPSRERLQSLLKYMLDESEFLSDHGVRSMSRIHADHPFHLELDGKRYSVAYVPGESDSGLFGGNSNWRGPVWFPMNYLLVEALETYHKFYGDSLQVECPTGSGVMMNAGEVAREISRRISSLFLRREDGTGRPADAADPRFAGDPAWKDCVLFYEYFHGDTGRGLGACHQTGWTGLIVDFLKRRDS